MLSPQEQNLTLELSGHESGQQRLEILSNRGSAISKERLELMEKEEEVSNTLSENRSELESLEESFEESQEVLRDVESQYHEKRDYLSSKLAERKSFQLSFNLLMIKSLISMTNLIVSINVKHLQKNGLKIQKLNLKRMKKKSVF